MYPRAYGQYVLLERIGAGGMSEIDLARRAVEDASYVRFLVIKRIKTDKTADDSFVRMFKDEARISAELHHSNIAQVYDFGKNGLEYYLVLEYVPGLDVRRILNTLRDRNQTMPLRIALRIVCDVLDGLNYAHGRLDPLGRPMQIVHRDVNPRNIMVSTRGEVKLIDFGVAKAQDRLEKTQTDHVKGKFAYMAPEQVQAGADVDHRADQFAAALTLHEMVAGVGPFHALNQVQIMHRLLSGSLPELPAHPDLPDPTPLRRVQRKALATDPGKRYRDCEAYRKDLEKVADRLGGLATREEVARFVAEVDGELEAKLKTKIAAWSGPLELGEGPLAPGDGSFALDPTNPTHAQPAPNAPNAPEVTGSISQRGTATGLTSVTRTGVVVAAGGGLALAAIGVVGLLLVLVGVVAVYGNPLSTTTAEAGRTEAPLATVVGSTPEPVLEVPSPETPANPMGTSTGDATSTASATGATSSGTTTSAGATSAGTTSTGTASSGTSSGTSADKHHEATSDILTDRGQGTDGTSGTTSSGTTSFGATSDGTSAGAPGAATSSGSTSSGTTSSGATSSGTTDAATADGGTAGSPGTTSGAATTSTAAAAKPGKIQVASSAAGLPITIDGVLTSYKTPAKNIELSPGTHTVSVPGFPDKTVTVKSEQVDSVLFK